MQVRRVVIGNQQRVELLSPHGWVSVAPVLARLPQLSAIDASDALALLALSVEMQLQLVAAASDVAALADDARPVLPFVPRSFRDFMLFEAHAVDTARGMVKRFMPGVARVVGAYEAVTGRTFPGLKPHALWYRQPIYYFGNHMTFATDGEEIAIPPYTRALDYELELGFVLAHPLLNATPEEAERAIGGFVVLNDFSARDVQLAEMRSGFGPQKAKHFASAMSAVIVSADEILPRWRDLKASVRLNGNRVAECATADAHWSLGDALAHASRGERLYPGELMGTGTLPGGSGIESGRLLGPEDTISLAIEGVGTLTNRIA